MDKIKNINDDTNDGPQVVVRRKTTKNFNFPKTRRKSSVASNRIISPNPVRELSSSSDSVQDLRISEKSSEDDSDNSVTTKSGVNRSKHYPSVKEVNFNFSTKLIKRPTLQMSKLSPVPRGSVNPDASPLFKNKDIMNKSSSKIFDLIQVYNQKNTELNSFASAMDKIGEEDTGSSASSVSMNTSLRKSISLKKKKSMIKTNPIQASKKKSSRSKPYYLHPVELSNEVIETNVDLGKTAKSEGNTFRPMTITTSKNSGSSLRRRKLYGSKWYLDQKFWEKSMKEHKTKQEFLISASMVEKTKIKTKFEFKQMIESMKATEAATILPINPFRNRFNNFGSIHTMLDEEQVNKTKGDLHMKFIEDVHNVIHQG